MIETLIIIVFIIILALFVSMIFNFKAMLDFKWNIDYFVLKDAICEEYRWTKFEIEGLRYNLSKFLYNDKAFERIIKDYKITYSLITLFASILLILFILISILSRFMGVEIMENFSFMRMIILIVIVAIHVIYIAITSWYLEYLNTLQSYNNDTDIGKYYKCYKILSSIIMMSHLKDQKVELLHPAFTKLSLTFDQLLERNIASYENTGNTSKVKNIKLNVYANLDFLKYFVFDTLSPYYLKYFDNVYLQNATGQIMYLDDLYKIYTSSYNTNDYKIVDNNLKKLSSALEYYQTNQTIEGIISKSGVNISVDNDDYIKYFIDNKDILFNDEKLSDFKYKLNEHSNAIYTYYVYFSIIFFIISHYFYHTLEGSTYIYTILGTILIYILFVWLYTQISFMSNTA